MKALINKLERVPVHGKSGVERHLSRNLCIFSITGITFVTHLIYREHYADAGNYNTSQWPFIV